MMHVLPSAEAVAAAVADFVVDQANRAIAQRSRFCVALSGGQTPRRVYERLAEPSLAKRIDWTHVHIFWGDERCVGPEDPKSNYKLAHDALLAHVPIPPAQIHRIQGEQPPKTAASEYDAILHKNFPSGPPYLDLILLGLGADGHTASLFPHSPAITDQTRWAVEVTAPQVELARVTLTPTFINQSRVVAFVVTGDAKADILHQLFSGSRDPMRWPVHSIQSVAGEPQWFVDAAACAVPRAP